MAVVTSVVSLLLQAPALEVKRRFFPIIVEQGAHPLRPLAVVDEATHESKLAFRLVPPLLVDTFHLSVEGYYVVQGILGIATLAGLAWLFHRVGYTRRHAAALVVGLAFTYMGAVWFLDTQPYFDALAASALVLALCVPHPVAVFAGASLALWTDERSILALGVVALFHWWRNRREATWAAAAAFAAYLVVRFALGARYGLSTGQSEVGPAVLVDYWTAMPLAMLVSLEALLVVLGVAYVTALRRGDWVPVAAGVLTAGTIAVAMMVNDVTRSTVYALPGVVFALAYLADAPVHLRRWGLRATLACVVIPTGSAIVVTGAVFDHLSFFYPLPVRLLF